jgi:hypothetical protein
MENLADFVALSANYYQICSCKCCWRRKTGIHTVNTRNKTADGNRSQETILSRCAAGFSSFIVIVTADAGGRTDEFSLTSVRRPIYRPTTERVNQNYARLSGYLLVERVPVSCSRCDGFHILPKSTLLLEEYIILKMKQKFLIVRERESLSWHL